MMAEEEKTGEVAAADHTPEVNVEEAGQAAPRKGWMYKTYKLGPIKTSSYASPPTQLILVAFVCFLCPGMYNSLSGLGGGGQIDPTVADNSAVALYSCFSVVGFFAGTVVNRLGIKISLSFGGFGYFLYSSSLLSYNNDKNAGFVIFAGALLGVCAGILWAAQGAIMMSYPTEASKGRYISWFWMIFNLGGVIGSLVGVHWLSAQIGILSVYFADSTRSEYSYHDGWQCKRWHIHCIHRAHVLWSCTGLDARGR